ncbi:hypothetical protein [Streptomyces coeruleorubidus]|uniref:hypothetical protein n=1 Tax=Streptomyces coeruleorubidus TaxID=116188 RepID=UPI003157FBC5
MVARWLPHRPYVQAVDQALADRGIPPGIVRPAPGRLRQTAPVFEEYRASAVKDGDDPAVVAKEIVAAATGAKPKLRYTAGATTGRVRTMRRMIPSRIFDQQLRKLNRLPA